MNVRWCIVILLISCLFFSGCSLLKLPFQVLGGLWEILMKMPKPPPGVF